MPVYEEKEKVNGQKRWYIRTYITNEDGIKKQITRHNKEWIGRDGKKEAEWEETKLQNKILITNSNTLFKDHLQDFLEFKKSEVEITTYYLYNQIINLYIKPKIPGSKKINEFTKKDALLFQKYLIGKDFSLSFKKNIYTITTMIFEYAERKYEITNVFKLVGNFKKTKKDSNLEMNIMTTDEFESFIFQEKSNIYTYFFKLLFYTGMRKGELLGLKWENINFEKKTIKIKNNYNSNYKIELKPKTKKSQREILMSDIVYNIISNIKKGSESEYLFKNIINASTLRDHCKSNLKKAKINKKIRIHDFRHSFASMCIEKGIPIEVISEYLGHEHITTTLNVYGHLYPNSQQKLVNVLNSL